MAIQIIFYGAATVYGLLAVLLLIWDDQGGSVEEPILPSIEPVSPGCAEPQGRRRAA